MSDRYAAYLRVSREDQSLYSLRAQHNAIEKWVRVKGGEVVEAYVDDGVSGRTANRPAFNRMRDDAAHGKFDAVVVHRFDRFARNSTDALAIKSLFRRDYGIKVYSVTEPSEDSHGEIGALIEAIMDLLAEWYSRNLSTDVAKGRFEKASQGYHNNQAPLGLKKDSNGVLIPDYSTLPAVQLAFELYATGEHSDVTVAQYLNEQGYRNRKGQRFTKDGIRAMLQNRTYIGYVRYQENRYHPDGRIDCSAPVQWFEGKHKPVIAVDLFEKCQTIRASKATNRTQLTKHRFYMLRNIIYCAECVGNKPAEVNDPDYGKMYPQPGSNPKNLYYRCLTRASGYYCSQKSFNILRIDPIVVRFLMKLELSEEWRDKVIHAVAEELQTQLREQRIEKVKAIIERMNFEKDFGFITRPYIYLRQHSILQRKIEALPTVPVDTLEQAADIVENFPKYWWGTAGDGEAQEQLIHLLVERVWVRDNTMTAILLKGNCMMNF